MPLTEFRRELALRRSLRQIKGLVPDDGSLTGLLDAVSRRTGRPLVQVEIDLSGSGLSGAWVPIGDEDYLLTPAGATPTRASAVICHELAHILLGHDPGFYFGGTLAKVQAAVQHLSPLTVQRMLGRTGYTDRQEHHAEFFATVLHTRLVGRRVAQDWRAASRISDRLR